MVLDYDKRIAKIKAIKQELTDAKAKSLELRNKKATNPLTMAHQENSELYKLHTEWNVGIMDTEDHITKLRTKLRNLE